MATSKAATSKAPAFNGTEAMKHVAVGAGGMILGATVVPTRVSFWAGAGIMAFAAWKKKPLLFTAGMGLAMAMPADMMMTGGANARMAQDPNKSKFSTFLDNAKNRAKMLFAAFGKKLSLDLAKKAVSGGKVPPGQTLPAGENGGMGGLGENPFDALDELNNRMAASALALRESNPEAFDTDDDFEDFDEGADAEMAGLYGEDFEDFSDLENPDLDDLEMATVNAEGDLEGFSLDDI